MKRIAVLVAVIAIGLLIAGGVDVGPLGPVFHRSTPVRAHGGIVSLRLAPIPEGPNSLIERTPSNPRSPRLSSVERFIPDPLPAPLQQWGCGTGGDLVVTFADGYQISYGPCHRPASIDLLWARMFSVLWHGACEPHCDPNWDPSQS